ncbi:hypothetical protein SPHINGOAX6_60053 [Sphingomonas sp. AX6]|nr:hypothetical protein SPHINGOAX6_60053 [Sphingomonas sp. AX6]
MCQRDIEFDMGTNLGAALRAARGDGGQAGVDFDDHRSAIGQRIEWPDRHMPAQPVENAHSRQARFSDLCRAHEVEVAIGVEALFALRLFGYAQPPAPLELRALAVAVATKMLCGWRVIDEIAGGEMRIGVAHCIDQRPQRAGVGRALGPAGEERAAIDEGERGAEVEADERVGGHVAAQPVEDLGARPAVGGANEFWCGGAGRAQGEREAAVALALCAGPIDGRVMGEARH